MKDVIEREQRLQKNKSKKVRAAYAPHIELLPADKMAVIVMHKMMGLVMSGHGMGVSKLFKLLLVSALDTLGNTKWRFPYQVSVSEDPEEIQLWKWTINILFLFDLLTEDNKFQMARKMKDEEGFYYPHNLDFKDIP
ncbi:hypothetical protein YC2023_008134 [Brassica napus]